MLKEELGIKNFIVNEKEDIRFDWDDAKNEINKRKHGISFETAALIFFDENRIEEYDANHDENEDRYISIGAINKVLTVVHTDRESSLRIISARKATKEEKERYYGQFDC